MAINPILLAVQHFSRHLFNATGCKSVARVELEPNVYRQLESDLRFTRTGQPPEGARVVNTRDTTGIITVATDCGQVEVVQKRAGTTATVTGVNVGAGAVTCAVDMPNDFPDLSEHLRRNGEESMRRYSGGEADRIGYVLSQRPTPIGHEEWDRLVRESEAARSATEPSVPEPTLAHPAGSGAIFSGAPTSEAPRGMPRRRRPRG